MMKPPQLLSRVMFGAAVSTLLLALAFLLFLVVRIVWIRAQRLDGQACPKCGGTNLRHSHSSSWMDLLYLLGACVPYRCRGCRHRFYRREEKYEAPPKGGSPRPERQRLREGRGLAATVAVCIALLMSLPV